MSSSPLVYLLSGGSGFVGTAIAGQLVAKGCKVYIYTRGNSKVEKGINYLRWNPATGEADSNGIEEETNVYIIHLAGAGVADKRWTKERKAEILRSRVDSVEFLLSLIKNKKINASYIAFASAIGYYGGSEDYCLENSLPGNDFLSSTCVHWEKTAHATSSLSIPYSIIRIGLVMGPKGGAILEFIKQIKWGIAGIPGNGKQWYSWIHQDDLAALFIHATEKQLEGIYNAVAPDVQTAKKLITTLAKAYKGWYIPVFAPSFLLRIIIGEMSVEVLKSCKVSSQKIIETGFRFKYNTLSAAMTQIAEALKNPH